MVGEESHAGCGFPEQLAALSPHSLSRGSSLQPCPLLCRAQTPFQTSSLPSARGLFPLGKAHLGLASALPEPCLGAS